LLLDLLIQRLCTLTLLREVLSELFLLSLEGLYLS